MLQQFRKEMEGTTGSANRLCDTHQKDPVGKLIISLKLLQPKRPEGYKHITQDFKKPIHSSLLEYVGWGKAVA
jgi:hypothetical protein